MKSIPPKAGRTGGGVTSSSVKVAAIIPARMGSIRLPGKPLIEIEGLPMVEHVRRRALLCRGFSEVVVATCDEEISEVIQSFGGEVLMTSNKHQVATERIIEAIEKIDCTHVVNVQGDEILVLPVDLEKMVHAIQEAPENHVWNAVAHIEKKEELKDPAIVKCVLSQKGDLLYCSRDFSYLPLSVQNRFEPVRWIIGLLAYSRQGLKIFQKLVKTPLEEMESIEQMRFLENGIPIFSVSFTKAYPGINELREADYVKKHLREDPLQREVLKRILG